MIRQYVGARYVPKFANPVAWASGTGYEALTIVTYNNSSYTSKMPVPATVGNPADNPDYWALTGNYNAQVEQYRQETETVSNNLTTLQGQVTTEITNRETADTTLQGQITTEITNRETADTTLQGQITTEISNRKTADATLQNYIEAESTARQTANNTLQDNISSEAATRASADSNLQSQINQIVAPSGEAPSAAEVQNARIGADGVTYDTLGTAIRTQVNTLTTDVDDTNNTLYSSVGYYGKKILNKSGDYVVNLPRGTYTISGKSYSIPNGINTTVVLFNDVPYKSTNPGNVTVWDNQYTAFMEKTITLSKAYKYMHVWGQDNFSQPVELTINEDGEIYHGKTEKITDLSYIKYDIYENGDTGEVVHNDLVSTRKIYEKALYLIAFPESLKCKYNAKDYTGERKNFEIDTPFSVHNDDFIRFSFKKRNGENLEPNDPVLSNVIVYKVIGKSTCYDVTVSASDTDQKKKEKSDIVLDGKNDTKILAALIGCHESISVYLYGGTYNISEMWTTYANTKIALSVNMANNFDGGSGYRRYINVIGEAPCSPQALKSTVFKVTEDLHSNMNSLGHYFVFGTSYPETSDPITRLATSIVAKNINIIGYKYDKPITYIDTTRCLSTMLDSVNVRSWAENIEKYNQFSSLPNMECCGIRVGRGSNYGIQNHVKNSNVWYCGKGISCNGDHFLFEDVKTHHCYVGWYFGDKKTVGMFEHTNIMIGCTIEGCYRMMILSKQGITEEKPYEDGEGYKHSPLRIIGLATETWWSGTADNASPSQATLPILEILKGCYTGSVEIESDILNVFEDGSGENMSYTRYSGSKTYTRSSKNTIIE